MAKPSSESAKLIACAAFIIGFHSARLKTMVTCFKEFGGIAQPSTDVGTEFMDSKDPYMLTETFVHASSKIALDEAFANLPSHLTGLHLPPGAVRYIAKAIKELEAEILAGKQPYRLRRFDLVF